MKVKAKAISELVLGILFVVMTTLGYYQETSHMWEYCFLSGLTVGIVMLASFVYSLVTKKQVPAWIHLACTTDVLLIMMATIAMGLNLDGAFWFIHIINPALLLVFWFVFCDGRSIRRPQFVGITLAFPIAYLAVSFVRLKITGLCAFPADRILRWTPQIIALPIVLVLSIVVLLLGFGLYALNRLIHKNVATEQRDVA